MLAVARKFAVSVSLVSGAWRHYQETYHTTVHLEMDVEEVVGGQQPCIRTTTSSFVQGQTGGALPECCKMTPSMLQLCTSAKKMLETNAMRVV